MGYTTDFSGQFAVVPPLNEAEIAYLEAFSGSRRMNRRSGPYTVPKDGRDERGPDVIDNNQPPPCQPGLWCQWVPADEGAAIEWDGGEKFYNASEWAAYLLAHFLNPDPAAKLLHPEQFGFLQGHELSGRVTAVGEDGLNDCWQLEIRDGRIWTRSATFTDSQISEMGFDPDDEDDCGDGDVMGFALASEADIAWSEWELVPEFADPELDAWVRALRERNAIETALPPVDDRPRPSI